MIKIYLIFIMWLGSFFLLSAQHPVFECNFNQGIPHEFSLLDKDGAIPDHLHTDFPENTAWIAAFDPDDPENTVACSTSLYEDRNATSDDWMILPSIQLPEEPVSLFWRTRSAYSTYKDGYKVFISTDKDDLIDPSSITRKELIYVPREEAVWKSHDVKLSEFAGKTVYIAFQNCANMGWFLYLDDITIGAKEDVKKLDLKITSDKYAENNLGIISASIKTGILTTVTDFTVRVESGEVTWEQVFEGFSLGPNKKYEFILNDKLEGKAPETKDYSLSILLDDVVEVSETASMTYLLDVDNTKRVVGEALTAIWDGYGPRVNEGISMMDKKYPGDFLGICVHGYGSEDPMSILGDNYLNILKAEGADYNKKMLFDRTLVGEPYSDIENLYQIQKKEKAFVGVSVNGSCDDELIKATVEIRFALDLEHLDYRCLLVLSENGVTDISPAYYQKNIYSTGYYGSFLGYEKLPNDIPGVKYDHVARMCYPNEEGDDCFKDFMIANDTINREYEFVIPENILNRLNLELTAIIIDMVTGKIVNANRAQLAYTGTLVEENFCNPDMQINVINNQISVRPVGRDFLSIQLYNTQGILVGNEQGEGEVVFNLNETGVYILHIVYGNTIMIKKIIMK